jgi:hypothetical protein
MDEDDIAVAFRQLVGRLKGGLLAWSSLRKPPSEDTHTIRRPRTVARHLAVFESGEDRGCVLGDVVKRPEVEVGPHRCAILLAKERLDISGETDRIACAI